MWHSHLSEIDSLLGSVFFKKTSVGDRTRQLGTIELVNVVWNVSCAFGRVERVPSNVYTAGRGTSVRLWRCGLKGISSSLLKGYRAYRCELSLPEVCSLVFLLYLYSPHRIINYFAFLQGLQSQNIWRRGNCLLILWCRSCRWVSLRACGLGLNWLKLVRFCACLGVANSY